MSRDMRAMNAPAMAIAAAILAWGMNSAAWAQSTPQSTPPTVPPTTAPADPQPDTTGTPASTPSQTPDAQQTPGTTPVDGDKPAASDKDKKDKNKKDPSVGTEPVKGDVPASSVDPEKVIEPGSQKINVKNGSIEDVNAVGNREIGGRGMGNWYSTDSEIKMGKQYASEIEKSTKFINDSVVTEYVNRIGQNIVKNSDCKVPFSIKVIASDEINAMALPGGYFYVNSGLILN